MKRKAWLILVLITFIISMTFNTFQVEAAGAKSATVNADVLNVREKAGTKYKKLGTLKMNTVLSVYSSSKNGWSEIRYKKKKAYVMTEFLTFNSGYAKNKSNIYYYKSSEGTVEQKFLYNDPSYGFNIWSSRMNGKELGQFVDFENKSGYHVGILESEGYTNLKYPLKLGKTWSNGYEGEEEYSKITSLSKTVKTPAGTFTNCVEVKSNDNYTSYFARGVGFVKGVQNGKTVFELVKIKKK